MSKTAHVVDGEASESDTDSEEGISTDFDLSNSKAFVIPGEAPESEDESRVPTPSKSDLDAPINIQMSPQATSMRHMHTSLLHQKLWECNVSLRATVEGLVKHTTDISVEKLTRADKILLSVQESMRSTATALTLGRARLQQLRDQLENANCADAFPTVIVQ